MKNTNTLILALLILFFNSCKEEVPLIHSIDFNAFETGSFTGMEDAVGSWSAEEGHASIFEVNRGKKENALKLEAGSDRAVVYSFKQPQNSIRHIIFRTYNLSRQATAEFTLEKMVGGEWAALKKMTFAENRKRKAESVVVENEDTIEKIRFSSNTPEKGGILIDDLEFVSAAPMQVKEVVGYSPVYPVLIGKENNPVFRINMQTAGISDAGEVSEIKLNLNGTDELSDIHAVKAFYSSNNDNFSDEKLFGEATNIAAQITISGNQKLSHGKNYFWLSITLNDGADVLRKVAANAVEVVMSGKSHALPGDIPIPAKRLGHALRQHNDDGVDTYRIPGLATTNNGTLVAVYDIRRNSSVDLQEDVDIGMNRSTDGGQTWEPMKVIMDMGEWGGLPQDQNGIGDPAVLIDRQTNTIWVAAVWAHGHPGKRNWWASKKGMKPVETSQFVLVKSEDDGLTWSEPINITSQIKNPKWHLLLQGPGKGITLNDGTLVFPAQFKDEEEMPHSTLIYSKDHGKSWHIGTGAKSNTTEAQIVELSDGSLMLNMRDNRGSGKGGRNGTGARSIATTMDLGKTWTEHPTSRKALIEPVCMASLIKHSMGNDGKSILLFSNPVDQYVRQNMTIKISKDEGMTWPEKYHTLIDEGRGRGYSCMTSIDENTIGILYEGSQSDLVFQKISLAELMHL